MNDKEEKLLLKQINIGSISTFTKLVTDKQYESALAESCNVLKELFEIHQKKSKQSTNRLKGLYFSPSTKDNAEFSTYVLNTLSFRAICLIMCFEFKNILEELECLFSLCTQWFAVIKLTPSYKDKLHSIRNTLLKPIPFLQQKIQTINNESLASKAIDFYITAGSYASSDLQFIKYYGDQLLVKVVPILDTYELFESKFKLIEHFLNYYNPYINPKPDSNHCFLKPGEPDLLIETYYCLGLMHMIHTILQTAIKNANLNPALHQYLDSSIKMLKNFKIINYLALNIIGILGSLRATFATDIYPTKPSIKPSLEIPDMEMVRKFEIFFLSFGPFIDLLYSSDEFKEIAEKTPKNAESIKDLSANLAHNRGDYQKERDYLDFVIDLLREEKKFQQMSLLGHYYFNRAVSLINQKHEASIYFARQAYAISKEVSLNNVNVDVKNFVTLEQLILQCAKFEKKTDAFLTIEGRLIECLTNTKKENQHRQVLVEIVKSFIKTKIEEHKAGNQKAMRKFLYDTLRKLSSVSPLEIGFVMEEEIACYESCLGDFGLSAPLNVINNLLIVYESFPLQRASILVEKFRLERNPESSLDGITEAIQIYNSAISSNSSPESELLDCLAIAHTWLGILQRESNIKVACNYQTWMENLNKALLYWTKLIKHSPVNANLEKKFRRPSFTLQLLMQLSDLFDLIYEHEKQIHCLEIIVSLHQTIFSKAPDSTHNIVINLAKIGGICNRLGYGGMAESYFSQARKLIVEKNLDTLPKSNEGSLTNSDWLLVSSIYLYQKGEIESIDELKKYQESLLELYHTKKNYSFEVVTSLARFTSLLASLFHHECRLDEAITEALFALQLWTNMLPQKSSELYHKQKKGNIPSSKVNHNSSFNKWGLTSNLFSCLLQIADLYEQLGAFREAEGCYHKVLNLAALLNIPKLKAVPLLKLAELYDKKRNTEESNKYFGLLKELKEEVSKFTLVESSEAQGDFHLRQKQPDIAHQNYIGATTCLSELIDQSYILELVNIVSNSRAELTPREKKIVSRVRNNAKAPVKKPATSARRNKRVIEDEDDEEMQIETKKETKEDEAKEEVSECLPLKCVENRIKSKRGDVELEKGNLDEAETIFREGLSKYNFLNKNLVSKKYDIDKMNLLFNLGRVSLAKGIKLNPEIINLIWSSPKQIASRLEKAKLVVLDEYANKQQEEEETQDKAEDVSTQPSKPTRATRGAKTTKGGKAAAKKEEKKIEIEKNAEYYIERAKYFFSLSLMYCLRCGATPKLTQDICQQLALATGNTYPEKTASLINFGVGITFVHSELVFITKKLLEIKKETFQQGVEKEEQDINALTSRLGKLNMEPSLSKSKKESTKSTAKAIPEKASNVKTKSNGKIEISDSSDETSDLDLDDEDSFESILGVNNQSKTNQKEIPKEEKKAPVNLMPNDSKVAFYEHYYNSLRTIRNDLAFHPERFQSSIINSFPLNWTVCNVSVTNDFQYMIITRLQKTNPRNKSPRIPLVVRIPLTTRQKTTVVVAPTSTTTTKKTGATQSRAGQKSAPKSTTSTVNTSSTQPATVSQQKIYTSYNLYEQIHEEFIALTEENKQFLKDQPADRHDNGVKDKYWTKRESLESKLKSIIDKVEAKLFGDWLFLLLGSFQSSTLQTEFDEAFEFLIEDIETQCEYTLSSAKKELLYVFFCGLGWLSDEEDRPYKVLKNIINWDVEKDFDEDDEESDLSESTSKKRRNILKEIGQLMIDKYVEIVSQYGDQEPFPKQFESARNADWKPKSAYDYASIQRHSPVILILDKHVHDLPLESMSFLINQPVCRMPSLILMKSRIDRFFNKNSSQSIDNYGPSLDKFFYILNPDGSSPTIDEIVSPTLKKFNLQNGSNGKQEQDELIRLFKAGVSENEILLYCGHNAGEQYIPREDIRKISSCKVALLMGCSSVLLDTNGDYEPSGNVLSYILSDCHATIGNLWVVTDRDLNNCTQILLEKWLSSEGPPMSLLDCVRPARKKCKFPFLNGASLVYYGLPNVYLQKK